MKSTLIKNLKVGVLAIFLCIPLTGCSSFDRMDAQRHISSLEEKATKAGFKNVKIVYEKDYDGTHWYNMNCDSLSKYTNEELIDMMSNLKDMMSDEGYSYPDYMINEIDDGQNKYGIYGDIVKKNGKQIYDRFLAKKDTETDESKDVPDEIEDVTNTYGPDAPMYEVTDDSILSKCWVCAEDTVKTQLKAPSTAEFPFSYGSDGVQILQQGNYYYVKGWVDAENSFGAMIRNDFVVTMYQDGEFMTAEDCIMKER